MRGLLERLLYPRINTVMREKAKSNASYRRYIRKHGGLAKCSRWEANNIVNIFYNLTFKERKGREPYAEPYIVSFCAHTDADAYVKENGLLSMWRAYGDTGGFALVFDTKHLWNCLEREPKHYGYSAFYLADVVYDDQEDRLEEEFSELTDVLDKFITAQAQAKDLPTAAGYVFRPFFGAVTRYKHRGFREECEVRLTASPFPKTIYEEAPAQGLDPPKEEVKPILTREKRGKKIKYVAINDLPQRKNLPVAKIIIGPQRDQAKRVREIKALIGKKRIGVTCSKTPFIPG